jgi:hypothetical protein
MSEPIWNAFLTERDKAVFGKAGFGARFTNELLDAI